MFIHPALQTPYDVQEEIARKVKARRLEMNISQTELAEKSGVSLGSLRRFERTGEISLKSFLEIAFVLGELKEISALFPSRVNISLFEKETPPRKRSRKKKESV